MVTIIMIKNSAINFSPDRIRTEFTARTSQSHPEALEGHAWSQLRDLYAPADISTVTRRGWRQGSPVSDTLHSRQKSKQSSQTDSLFVPALKAGLFGGCCHLILMLIGLIPPSEHLPFVSLAILVVPGFLVVCLSTGLLAGILADDAIDNSWQGGQVGWIAGYWAGIMAGIMAMFLAVPGVLMVSMGQGVIRQFTPEQLEIWGRHITPDSLALVGRVLSAFIVYGLIGSLVSAVFSSIGGLIYPGLRSN